MAINMMIDEKAIEAEEGMTILEAARQNGIHIPTLCYMKELKPQASCRIGREWLSGQIRRNCAGTES